MIKSKNKIEQLKGKFEAENVQGIALSLIDIYEENPKNFSKSIMLSGILPEPLSFEVSKKREIVDKFYEASKLSKHLVHTNQKYYKDDFIKEINNILNVYEIIKSKGISNGEVFDTCNFRKYSKERQIQMICLFIEDQMNLANKSNITDFDKRNSFYTGIESNIPLNIQGNDLYKMSSSDNMEAHINAAEEMFRYIFYINKKCMKDEVIDLSIDANPYYNPDFEKIIKLADHRAVLKGLWDKAKYRGWKLFVEKDEENDNIYYFIPDDIERYKKERSSMERASYRDMQRVMKGMTISSIANPDIFRRIRKLKVEKIKDIFSLDTCIIRDLINSFDISMKEYMYFLNLFYGDKLLNLEIKENITFRMIVDTIKYLSSVATISKTIDNTPDKFESGDEYLDIAPIISIEIIVSQLANTLGISKELAKECLNVFIFSPKDESISLDLFSQPLVYLSDKQVVFTPTLILQMNIERVIEKILSKIENNISEKGTNMEKYMIERLKESKYIKVNTSPIKFIAYDGKEVEFDFLGIFDDKLVIMEMKCRTTPYSSKEIMDKENVLQEVIDQVNRRVKVVQNNWDQIKNKSSIELMDNPPKDSDIIKIGCFNFVNFTGINMDGVYISDCSAIVKYFTQPINYATVAYGSKVVNYEVENLWKNDYPTIHNFEEFLKMPSMMKIFYDKLECLFRPVSLIDEKDKKLCFFDYYMSENPISNYKCIEKASFINNIKYSKSKKKKHNRKQSKKSKKKNRKNKI